MRYSNPTIQDASQMVNVVCGALFFLFAFLFIVHFQDGLLSFAQHFYSGGRTEYHPVVSALLTATLLTALGVVLSRFLILPLYIRAVAWMPSALLLGMLTDINIPDVFPTHEGAPWWAFLLLLLLFLLVIFLGYQWRDNASLSGSKLPFLCSNLALLTLFLFMAASLSNTDEYQHRLLSLEQRIVEGDDEEALAQLQGNTSASGNLLPLEAYILARRGFLPDSLFVSGHFTSSRQLLPSYADTLRAVALPKRLAELFGVPLDSSSQDNPVRYLRTVTNDTLCRPAVKDYLLCALLLDRNLPHFAQYLALTDTLTDTLPIRYREALVLHNYISPRRAVAYQSDSLYYCLHEFLVGRFAPQLPPDSLLTTDSLARIHRKYDHTYWDYYYK